MRLAPFRIISYPVPLPTPAEAASLARPFRAFSLADDGLVQEKARELDLFFSVSGGADGQAPVGIVSSLWRALVQRGRLRPQ